ncbi:MAG TPA: DOMON-like domain-containing protein [Allosphingosinicella sp.]|jgi:hypothetical protein
MRRRLVPHPGTPSSAVDSIHVDLARSAGGVLGLRYVLIGRIAELAIPPPIRSRQGTDLWRHTCFEAFFADAEGEGYAELNVSPSTEWAGYRFESYRAGMKDANLPPPRIEVERAENRLELRVALKLRAGGGSRRLGLSAVIEAADGNLSYWALAHPPGAPDFHHRDCFQIELPPLGEG